MKIQKTLNIDSDTIEALAEKYPDVPFTKLVSQGLKLLLDPNIVNKKVVLQDDVMDKFNRLCDRVYTMHKEFVTTN